MYSWFLIVVLVNPADPLIEQHITIHMPSEEACNLVKDRFVYGEDVDISTTPNERTKLTVTDRQCLKTLSSPIKPTGAV